MHSMWALLGSALLGLSQVSAISEPFSLYAYGTGISGLPVFYMGSYAYIGSSIPATASDAAHITFTMNSSSLHIQNNATATGGSANLTDNPMLYIDTASGATAPSGFTANGTLGYSTTNFKVLGNAVYWQDTNGNELLSSFWATTTDMDGVYRLVWNQPNEVLTDSVPVTVQATES